MQKVEKFYDGYESATGIETSGQLTLNENIADIGAMACALDTVAKLGNVDYDKFFTAYGKLFLTPLQGSIYHYYPLWTNIPTAL